MGEVSSVDTVLAGLVSGVVELSGYEFAAQARLGGTVVRVSTGAGDSLVHFLFEFDSGSVSTAHIDRGVLSSELQEIRAAGAGQGEVRDRVVAAHVDYLKSRIGGGV